MEKLNIVAVVIEACFFVWRKRVRLLLLALPGIGVFSVAPFVGSLLISGNLNPYSHNSNSLTISNIWESENWALGFTFFGLWIAILLPFIMFSIAWHREYLEPDEAEGLKAAYVWRLRQRKFFRIYFDWFVLILVAVPVILFSVTLLLPIFDETLGRDSISDGVVLIFGLSWVICGWFYARIALAFPAISVDSPATSQGAWHLSRGNGWRLFAILAVISVVYGIMFWLISFVEQALSSVKDSSLALMAAIPIVFGSAILDFVGIAVGVTALSVAYRKLVASGAKIDAPQAG